MRPSAFRLSVSGFLIGAAAMAVAGAPPAQAPGELRIIHHGDSRVLAVRRFGGVPMVRLAEVAAALGGTLEPGTDKRQSVLRLAGQTIRVEAGRSFVRVGSATRVLRNPGIRRGGEWFVPLDFVSRVLPDVLPGESRYDGSEGTLAVGEGYPRLSVEIGRQPGITRVTVTSDPPAPMEITEGDRSVSVLIGAGFLDTSFLGEAPRDGVVERVDLYRAEEGYVLEVTTGRNYGRLLEERGRGRLEMDFVRAGVRAESGADVLPVRPAPGRRRERGPARARDIRTVAIDAGHGGPDRGTVGPGGVAEKDVALAVALALRDRLENESGLRVVLTRESDRAMELDDRTVAANAAHADLFVSIHLNASPSPDAFGSLVYYRSPESPGRARSDNTVHFVPWDDAQARFVAASRSLAESLAAELQEMPIPTVGIAHAPLRVFAGAAMPAVQVELGFVTSDRDREFLVRPEFPAQAARALSAGILRYRRAVGASRPTGPFP